MTKQTIEFWLRRRTDIYSVHLYLPKETDQWVEIECEWNVGEIDRLLIMNTSSTPSVFSVCEIKVFNTDGIPVYGSMEAVYRTSPDEFYLTDSKPATCHSFAGVTQSLFVALVVPVMIAPIRLFVPKGSINIGIRLTSGYSTIDRARCEIDIETDSCSDNHQQVAQKYQVANNLQTVKLEFADHPPVPNRNGSALRSSEWRAGETRSLGRMGGGGEPVRDPYGKLITTRGYKTEPLSWAGNSISLPSMERTCSRAKNALYREELQRQIEEKKRLEALERERTKQLEERIAERTEMQRQQMRAEYEKELQRTKNLEAELRRQQEFAKQLEEFQKRDAELRKRKSTEVHSHGENGYSNSESLQKRRSPSPPVPAVRTKELMERTVTPIQSLAQVKPENLFSSLAEIRRQILQNQDKKQTNASYKVMNRRTVADVDDESDDEVVSYSRVPSVAE
ncbi:uncharacterized protein LOC129216827 [Uloborus diversus]|uniref:uncharacterized protein LOC129216827 n=1 Tax=Uloborus diversus TaxID=327109 RepID=UPI002409E8DA|nr:uncharacterized protein LOC129216827 [Uloborus diversus]